MLWNASATEFNMFDQNDRLLKVFICCTTTPVHSARIVTQFLAKKQISLFQHPLYLPDLVPNDFFLFPRLKTHMKVQRYDDIEDIQANVTRKLKAISQEGFCNSFQ